MFYAYVDEMIIDNILFVDCIFSVIYLCCSWFLLSNIYEQISGLFRKEMYIYEVKQAELLLLIETHDHLVQERKNLFEKQQFSKQELLILQQKQAQELEIYLKTQEEECSQILEKELLEFKNKWNLKILPKTFLRKISVKINEKIKNFKQLEAACQ